MLILGTSHSWHIHCRLRKRTPPFRMLTLTCLLFFLSASTFSFNKNYFLGGEIALNWWFFSPPAFMSLFNKNSMPLRELQNFKSLQFAVTKVQQIERKKMKWTQYKWQMSRRRFAVAAARTHLPFRSGSIWRSDTRKIPFLLLSVCPFIFIEDIRRKGSPQHMWCESDWLRLVQYDKIWYAENRYS